MIVGKNNSGKSNLLDGIMIAFSILNGDYCKIKKTDFFNSDDSKLIKIKVKLTYNDIPTLNFFDLDGNKCGFTIYIAKAPNGKYSKKIYLYNESNTDIDVLRDDVTLPNVYMIPLIRVDTLYTDWLSVGISKFISSEEEYLSLINSSKTAIKSAMNDKINKFRNFCEKFNQNFNIELLDPKITDEKVYIVDGDKEHNFCIGSGYKSIANILLNSIDEKNNIFLIDEIENHLHPSLLKNLIKEIKGLNNNTQIITTSHSPIVINEILNDEIIDISGVRLSDLTRENKDKITKFLHPGRCEIIFGENIVLVEGITEELLLKKYISDNKKNWTIVNVAGIMFEPYIELATLLQKKIVVISDTDIILTDNFKPSSRFQNLENYCKNNNVNVLQTYNTLESDLYKSKLIPDNLQSLLTKSKNSEIYIAKQGNKTALIKEMIESNVDLSNWHIIKEIENEFESN